jgi:hypothetical protein
MKISPHPKIEPGLTLMSGVEGYQKIPPHDTWESLEFNLDVGIIILCLVPQSSQFYDPGLPAATWI